MLLNLYNLLESTPVDPAWTTGRSWDKGQPIEGENITISKIIILVTLKKWEFNIPKVVLGINSTYVFNPSKLHSEKNDSVFPFVK